MINVLYSSNESDQLTDYKTIYKTVSLQVTENNVRLYHITYIIVYYITSYYIILLTFTDILGCRNRLVLGPNY